METTSESFGFRAFLALVSPCRQRLGVIVQYPRVEYSRIL